MDFNSSLPIRTENAGDVIIKVADATITSQQLAVNADGSVNITDNGGSITVDGSVTVSATDLDIRNLSASQDNVAISDGTDTLAVNADGSINSVVTATNLDIRDLVFATDKVDVTGSDVTVSNTVTVQSTNLDIRDLVFATDKVDVSGSTVALDAPTLAALESITVQNGAGAAAVNIQDGGNSITVDSVDLDIRDLTHVSDSVKIGDGTDFLAINVDGSINVVPQEDPGTERVNFDTTASVAAGASDNHDFVFTNSAKLFQVQASASGKLKAEVQIETGSATNVFNTVMVGFNSTATPNIDLMFAKYALVPAGARVRVIRTNRDNQAQDVYSTIIAIES